MRTTLDQWRVFQAVIDQGGFAQAAEFLHRSQSSISYALNRLQQQLGLQLLQIEGRRAVLTEAGKLLLERARQVLNEATALEQQASYLSQGWETQLNLALETSYPMQLLMQALRQFELINKQTRIKLQEVVLSGAEQILLEGEADLVISPYIPLGFHGEELIQVHFVAVAHPDHPLHQLPAPLTTRELRHQTHIIVSDSGSKDMDAGWLNESQRWSVSSLDSAIRLISHGLGFGWLPEAAIHKPLQLQQLKPLPLAQDQRRTAILYLVYADLNNIGPATRQFADILKQQSGNESLGFGL